ncbi:MAG: glycosyltransferase [Prevotellaceae bacterium]|jgi:glycosyltransferase involved in cell wall biosynthesis|nr:glycosyltransferase [Prevotellaceae bacterium]
MDRLINNQKPLVSVLTPVYNGEKYIREAIDSILSQSYSNWEMIIVNDGSTDATGSIIDSYTDSRIQHVKIEKSRDLATVRNHAVSLASGKYIAKLDADDIALPQRIEKQIRFMETNPDYGLCGTWVKTIGKIGKIAYPTNHNLIKCALLFHSPFIASSVMIKTHLLKQIPYRTEMKFAEDYDLWERLSKAGVKMKNLNEYLVEYRLHESNSSTLYGGASPRINVKIRQLQDLALFPSDEEIQLLSDAANIKSVKSKIPIPEEFLCKLKLWMHKLLKANENKKIYDQNSLIAYLWFRWIFACYSLGQKKMIPQFGLSSLNLPAIRKLMCLLLEKL